MGAALGGGLNSSGCADVIRSAEHGCARGEDAVDRQIHVW